MRSYTTFGFLFLIFLIGFTPSGCSTPKHAFDPQDIHLRAAIEWLRTVEPDRYGYLSDIEMFALQDIRIDGSELPGAIDPLRNEGDLRHLAEFPNLQSLSIWTTGISSAGLQLLSGLTQLHALEVGGWGVKYTDAGLEYLHALRSLERLKLTHSQGITDQGMIHLARIPRLAYLDITYTNISDVGLANLLEAPRLQTVHYGWESKSKNWRHRFEAAHPKHSFFIE